MGVNSQGFSVGEKPSQTPPVRGGDSESLVTMRFSRIS
jgi:hypothetical protein